MLNQPAEYFVRLHSAEQSRLLIDAEHRRNAERRRTGIPDPLRRRPALDVVLQQLRLVSALRLPARPKAGTQVTCP